MARLLAGPLSWLLRSLFVHAADLSVSGRSGQHNHHNHRRHRRRRDHHLHHLPDRHDHHDRALMLISKTTTSPWIPPCGPHTSTDSHGLQRSLFPSTRTFICFYGIHALVGK